MIVILNPNSTVSMTEAMVMTARKAVPGCHIVGWTSHDGPAAIQGVADGEASVPPLLDLVAQACADGASAIIIGCSDDTGLAQARAAATCPVIGIGQAAYHLAALAGPRFSVVTTLAVSVPILEDNIAGYGLSGHLGRVRASGVAVLELKSDPEAATNRVIKEIRTAAAEDNVQSVVLGCAGMVGIPAAFDAAPPVRLIDGVVAATQIANLLS